MFMGRLVEMGLVNPSIVVSQLMCGRREQTETRIRIHHARAWIDIGTENDLSEIFARFIPSHTKCGTSVRVVTNVHIWVEIGERIDGPPNLVVSQRSLVATA
jgi:hypothetical protein